MTLIHGNLISYFETGTEGVIWSLFREADPELPDEDPYARTITICRGDYLEILGENDEIVWEGKIIPDTKSNWYPYHLNPIYGQQAAGSFWVHWVQKGVDPDTWENWFSSEHKARLTKVKDSHDLLSGSNHTDVMIPKLTLSNLHRMQPVLLLAMSQYLGKLGISDTDQHSILGVPADVALSREKVNEAPKLPRDTFLRIGSVVGVLRIGTYLLFDDASRIAWYNKPNPAAPMSGKRPIDLLLGDDVDHIHDLKNYLADTHQRCVTARQILPF